MTHASDETAATDADAKLVDDLKADDAIVAEQAHEIAALEALPAGVPSNFVKVWGDEFDGAALDLTKWDPKGFWYQSNLGSGGGADLDVESQVTVDGQSHLLITAVRQVNGKYTWLSGNVNSAPQGATPGYSVSPPFYIEWSAKMPAAGAGLWPALWMIHEGSSPYQELDMLECVNTPTIAYSSWHQTGSISQSQETVNGVDLSLAYHRFGAYATPTGIFWFLDGARAGNEEPATFTGPLIVVMDLAVGDAGSWPGASDASTPSPSVLAVDYVRVYAP